MLGGGFSGWGEIKNILVRNLKDGAIKTKYNTVSYIFRKSTLYFFIRAYNNIKERNIYPLEIHCH